MFHVLNLCVLAAVGWLHKVGYVRIMGTAAVRDRCCCKQVNSVWIRSGVKGKTGARDGSLVYRNLPDISLHAKLRAWRRPKHLKPLPDFLILRSSHLRLTQSCIYAVYTDCHSCLMWHLYPWPPMEQEQDLHAIRFDSLLIPVMQKASQLDIQYVTGKWEPVFLSQSGEFLS